MGLLGSQVKWDYWYLKCSGITGISSEVGLLGSSVKDVTLDLELKGISEWDLK